MTPALEADIRLYLKDRSIKQVDLMKKHGISRNTLKKYATLIGNLQMELYKYMVNGDKYGEETKIYS